MGWCNGTGTCFASKDGKTQYFDELVANRILFYREESNNTYYFPSHSEDELTNSQAGDESTNDVLNNKVQSEKKGLYASIGRFWRCWFEWYLTIYFTGILMVLNH